MSATSPWHLVGFQARIGDLGDLPQTVRLALKSWLTRLSRNPATVGATRIITGVHIGQTADEPEPPFPPYFRCVIRVGPDQSVVCEYFVDPDARTVTCVELKNG